MAEVRRGLGDTVGDVERVVACSFGHVAHDLLFDYAALLLLELGCDLG